MVKIIKQFPSGVPIPDTQFFFVGEEGDGFVDGVGLSSFFHGMGSPS